MEHRIVAAVSLTEICFASKVLKIIMMTAVKIPLIISVIIYVLNDAFKFIFKELFNNQIPIIVCLTDIFKQWDEQKKTLLS